MCKIIYHADGFKLEKKLVYAQSIEIDGHFPLCINLFVIHHICPPPPNFRWPIEVKTNSFRLVLHMTMVMSMEM